MDKGADSAIGQCNETGVFWLPFYHDMGLIGGILAPLYVGGHTVLMSPRAFLQRPVRWLQAISQYKATISGAPNFAYQLCVDRISPQQTDQLCLNHWRLAFCGAEPISPRTLMDFEKRFASCGFSSTSFYPCYGMAEATLLISGGEGPGAFNVLSLRRESYQQGVVEILTSDDAGSVSRKQRQELVGCGRAVANTEIVIVDPETRKTLPPETIGEIWVKGGSVTSGYFRDLATAVNADEAETASLTKQRFNAQTAEGVGGFCRSGDLGFLHDGQLYVTGRVKELVILRGRNLFPQDLEATAKGIVRSEFGLDRTDVQTTDINAAAFSVPGSRSEVLAMAIELPRIQSDVDLQELSRRVRRAIIDVHEIDPHHICLVRAASIPLTTSGKIRRNQCRDQFACGELKVKHRYDRSSLAEQAPIAFPSLPVKPEEDDRPQVQSAIEQWMSDWLMTRAGVAPNDLARETRLTDLGLDSLAAVELSGETEDWTGVLLTPEVAAENPSLATLSSYVANAYVDARI